MVSKHRLGAFQCFKLSQVLPIPEQPEKSILHVLHLAGVAYAADRWNDLRRWIRDQGDDIAAPSAATVEWDKRLLFRLYECWLRLHRKRDWDDLDRVREIIAGLREDQKTFEADLLKKDKPEDSSALAVRLVSLYHLAKGTKLLAVYTPQGEPAGIAAELDRHFEAAGKAALRAQDPPLPVLITWLHLSARRMVAGSLWWVARAVNSRVIEEQLIFSSRNDKLYRAGRERVPASLAMRRITEPMAEGSIRARTTSAFSSQWSSPLFHIPCQAEPTVHAAVVS